MTIVFMPKDLATVAGIFFFITPFLTRGKYATTLCYI